MNKKKTRFAHLKNLILQDEAQIFLLGPKKNRTHLKDLMHIARAHITEISVPLDALPMLQNHLLDLVVIPLSEKGAEEIHLGHLIKELNSQDCSILFVGRGQRKLIRKARLKDVQYMDEDEWSVLTSA